METSGDNSYSHHSGSRTAYQRGRGDSRNRSYGIKKIREACRALEEMKKITEVLPGSAVSEAAADDSSEED